MLLEDEIGDDAGRERERDQHQHDGATGNDQRTAWLHELEREREPCGHGDERDQPNRGIAGAEIDRIIGAPESPRGIVKQRGEPEIEIGQMPKTRPTPAATTSAITRPIRFMPLIPAHL